LKKEQQHKIILFDGVCNLCNSTVTFVIKHDPKGIFKFASLQQYKGQELVYNYDIDPLKVDSIVLIENGKAYTKSSAALRIFKRLKGGYAMLYLFMIIPSFIRDIVYDYIAKNRYKWYGKKDSCMLPAPEFISRFL